MSWQNIMAASSRKRTDYIVQEFIFEVPVYWPDVARTVAECDRISGQMSQDCWPDAARILT